MYENDPWGVFPGNCYEGASMGTEVRHCQCDDKEKCNTGVQVTSVHSVLIGVFLVTLVLYY